MSCIVIGCFGEGGFFPKSSPRFWSSLSPSLIGHGALTASHGVSRWKKWTRRDSPWRKITKIWPRFDDGRLATVEHQNPRRVHGVVTVYHGEFTVSSWWAHGEPRRGSRCGHGASRCTTVCSRRATVPSRCVHGDHGAFTVRFTVRSRWARIWYKSKCFLGLSSLASWTLHRGATWGTVNTPWTRRGLPWSAVTHRTEKIDSRRATVRSRWSTVRSRWARRVHGASTVCSRSFTVRSRWSGFWGRRERRRELRLNF